jgi:hypothetical protein
MKTETGPVSETLCFLVFRVPDDGQNPETQILLNFSCYAILVLQQTHYLSIDSEYVVRVGNSIKTCISAIFVTAALLQESKISVTPFSQVHASVILLAMNTAPEVLRWVISYGIIFLLCFF